MGYENWQDIGSGVIGGAAAGTAIAPGIGTAIGGLIGGIGGWLSGSEKARRNAVSEKYAAQEAANARQQTLMALAEKKKKQQWQMQFGDAFRNAMMNRYGQGIGA
jgi:hypothetical protein